MDVSSLSNISTEYLKNVVDSAAEYDTRSRDFSSVFQSALDMLNETNDLQNYAEEAEIQFALGYSTNTHDLRVAQEKANVALMYTVAVRDKVLEAYKEIMNMQM